MRNRLIWASATLSVVIAACGTSSGTSSPTPSPTCISAGAPHHAYVVVEHLSGISLQKCVGFASDTIDGQALMDQSGVEYATQTFSFGKGVCQVDNEPAQYTQCFPQNQPFWGLFVEVSGAWTAAATGYTTVKLHDKEALGWRYIPAGEAASPSPPPLAKES